MGNNLENLNSANMSRFGFRFDNGSAHTARSMMLEDLQLLLSCVDNPDSSKSDYLKAIQEDNCLKKRSVKTRMLTGRHLVYLYSLEPSITIFRVLRYFWERDTEGQPLVALLCSYSRDSLLRASAQFILPLREGEVVTQEAIEEFIDEQNPGRFSKATLGSTARNLSATWTKSGHLVANAKKIRSGAVATPGSAAYALFLGYLGGLRGEELFKTVFVRLLDCSVARCIELAEIASRSGWIVFKRLGRVMELQFSSLLTEQEKEWVHEQN